MRASLVEAGAHPAAPLPGARLRLDTRVGHWPTGSGMRGLRAWCAEAPCCPAAELGVRADGRRRCRSCGEWWSASHSDGLLALIRDAEPIGVDVQLPRRRTAALRALAAASGVESPTIGHWALAEAVLKAVGRAQRRPGPGMLPLPGALEGRLRWRLPEGERLEAAVTTLDGGAALAAVRVLRPR